MCSQKTPVMAVKCDVYFRGRYYSREGRRLDSDPPEGLDVPMWAIWAYHSAVSPPDASGHFIAVIV